MMNCLCKPNSLISFPAILLMFVASSNVGICEDEKTIEEIRKAYFENISRLRTLNLQWTDKLIAPGPADENSQKLDHIREITWIEEGEKLSLKIVTLSDKGNITFKRITNETKTWQYEFISGQEQPFLIWESPYDVEQGRVFKFGAGLGRYLGTCLWLSPGTNKVGLSIDQFLRTNQCEVVRIERINNSLCYVVECDGWQTTSGKQAGIKLKFWFDSVHGFLPVKKEMKVISKGNSVEQSSLSDIRKIKTESGETIYFPFKMISKSIRPNSGLTREITVNKAEFNREIPESEFSVPTGLQELIVDSTDPILRSKKKRELREARENSQN